MYDTPTLEASAMYSVCSRRHSPMQEPSLEAWPFAILVISDLTLCNDAVSCQLQRNRSLFVTSSHLSHLDSTNSSVASLVVFIHCFHP